MMKKQRSLITLVMPVAMVTAFVVPTAVFADEAGKTGYYTEMRAGANFVDDANVDRFRLGQFRAETEFDTGPTIGIAIGRKASADWVPTALRNLRFEGEFAYDQSDFGTADPSNAELTSTRFMANVLYQSPLSGRWARFSPYAGAGVGVALVEAEGASLTDNDDTVFAYQFRAGLTYDLNADMELSLGYRYLGAIDPEFGYAPGRFEIDYHAHAAEVGLRYGF